MYMQTVIKKVLYTFGLDWGDRGGGGVQADTKK